MRRDHNYVNKKMKKKDDGVPDGSAISRPTAKDVAARAGVSRTQVSYVLNGDQGSHVSEAKRRRIIAAAEELGYRPHLSAQALRRGYSNEFSIFFPAPYTPRINEMIGTIHEKGLANGCMPVQYSFNSYDDGERMRNTYHMLLSRRPFGLFCGGLDLGRDDIALALSKGVARILVLDVEDHEEFVTLRVPVEEVGYLACSHLLERGHGRIAILKPSDPVQSRPFRIRYGGMERAMRYHTSGEIVTLPWPEASIRPDMSGAREFVRAFLTMPRRPTALYAYSDDYALPILAALREHGVSVPDDVAIVGTDNMTYSAFVSPGLTTVEFDSTDLGLRAVAMINSLITDTPPDVSVIHPPHPALIVREST